MTPRDPTPTLPPWPALAGHSFCPQYRYQGRLAAAFLLFVSALVIPLSAQTHKVEIPQRVTRAVAVYEWTGDLARPDAARLVPVSLFINGHLQDAGVYLARPIPFALDTGNIYSIQSAGLEKGTLDLDNARDVITRRSATDDNPLSAWYGYGTFAVPPPEPKAPVLKASAHTAVIIGSSDDDRPHFAGKNQPGTAIPAKSPDTTADNDPDRPTLHRAGTPATSSTPANVPDNDPDRPTLRKRDPKADAARRKASNGAAVTPMDTSLNDDPDRPTMRTGKPLSLTAPPPLSALPANLHQLAAVSDASNREPHIFSREWTTPTERAETLAQLEALARPRIAAYMRSYQLSSPSSTGSSATGPAALQTPTNPGAPSSTTASSLSKVGHAHRPVRSRRPTIKTAVPPLTLNTEQLTPYTLSYGGLPTFVYSAESPLTDGGPVYLTLVAQRLPPGKLQVALSSITDAGHLNRTPWLRLVDAVDPDASHRASLLFELRAQSSRQFALYRLVSAQAEQQFVTGIIQ